TALRRLSTTVLVVAVLTAILVIVSLLSILRGNVDLSFLLAIAVFLALRDVLAFSRGAMDRMRQLSELVSARSSSGASGGPLSGTPRTGSAPAGRGTGLAAS